MHITVSGALRVVAVVAGLVAGFGLALYCLAELIGAQIGADQITVDGIFSLLALAAFVAIPKRSGITVRL